MALGEQGEETQKRELGRQTAHCLKLYLLPQLSPAATCDASNLNKLKIQEFSLSLHSRDKSD